MDDVKLYDFSKYGDFMAVPDFLDYCDGGSFIDYDGSGHLATKNGESLVTIFPSKARKTLSQNPWATHVMWFNR